MKKLIVGLLFLFSALLAFGQREIDENSKPSISDRLYFGGGIGFSSGTNAYSGRYTYIGLYPMIGYMATNKLSVGSTVTYQYYNYPDVGQSVAQYGISPFVRYNITQQFFAYGEFMILNTPTFDPNTPRRIYNRLPLGVGYSIPIGSNGRGSLNAMGLYDVLYNSSERVFTSPWVFRVFFSF